MKKCAHILFSVLCVGFLFAVMIGSLLVEKKESSYYENRALAVLPEMTWENFWDGSFFVAADKVVDDHIIGRSVIMRMSTRLDMALGRPVVSNLIVGGATDPILPFEPFYKEPNPWTPMAADMMGEQLGLLNELITGYGGYFTYVGVPQQREYFAASYPDYMATSAAEDATSRSLMAAALAERNVPFVNLYNWFSDMPELFYLTDHHFSFQGAMVTYGAVLGQVNAGTELNVPILGEGDWQMHTLPNPYLGSRNRQLYGLQETEERLVYATPTVAIPYNCWNEAYNASGRLIVLPQDEEEEITFLTYMGGDVPETIITTGRPELPTCLIFGDSFTNPVETLLWTAFDETRSLDLRHYNKQTLAAYIAEWQPDVVICMRDTSVFFERTGNGVFGFE